MWIQLHYTICAKKAAKCVFICTLFKRLHTVYRENFLGLNAGSMSWWATVLSSGTGARSSAEPHFFMEWNNEVIFRFLRSPAWVRPWHSLTSAWKTNIKAMLRKRPHCAWNNMLEGQRGWRQTDLKLILDSEKPLMWKTSSVLFPHVPHVKHLCVALHLCTKQGELRWTHIVHGLVIVSPVNWGNDTPSGRCSPADSPSLLWTYFSNIKLSNLSVTALYLCLLYWNIA